MGQQGHIRCSGPSALRAVRITLFNLGLLDEKHMCATACGSCQGHGAPWERCDPFCTQRHQQERDQAESIPDQPLTHRAERRPSSARDRVSCQQRRVPPHHSPTAPARAAQLGCGRGRDRARPSPGWSRRERTQPDVQRSPTRPRVTAAPPAPAAHSPPPRLWGRGHSDSAV